MLARCAMPRQANGWMRTCWLYAVVYRVGIRMLPYASPPYWAFGLGNFDLPHQCVQIPGKVVQMQRGLHRFLRADRILLDCHADLMNVVSDLAGGYRLLFGGGRDLLYLHRDGTELREHGIESLAGAFCFFGAPCHFLHPSFMAHCILVSCWSRHSNRYKHPKRTNTKNTAGAGHKYRCLTGDMLI